MAPMLFGVLFGILALLFSIEYVFPIVNKCMSYIWAEPSKQRVAIANRLKELYVDGDVPDETAVIIAAAESGASEEELLSLFDNMSASDIRTLVSGDARGLMGGIQARVFNALKNRK
jgi:hypothetical protein